MTGPAAFVWLLVAAASPSTAPGTSVTPGPATAPKEGGAEEQKPPRAGGGTGPAQPAAGAGCCTCAPCCPGCTAKPADCCAAEARALGWPDAALSATFVLAVLVVVVGAGVVSARSRNVGAEVEKELADLRRQDHARQQALAASLEKALADAPARAQAQADAARAWALQAFEVLSRSSSSATVALDEIVPPSCPAGAPVIVAARGRGFVAGSKVFFGDLPATHVTIASSRELHVEAPAGTRGTVPVTIVTPDGRVAALPQAFTYV